MYRDVDVFFQLSLCRFSRIFSLNLDFCVMFLPFSCLAVVLQKPLNCIYICVCRVLSFNWRPAISPPVKRSTVSSKMQFFKSSITNCYYWSIRSLALRSRSLAVLFEIENPVCVWLNVPSFLGVIVVLIYTPPLYVVFFSPCLSPHSYSAAMANNSAPNNAGSMSPNIIGAGAGGGILNSLPPSAPPADASGLMDAGKRARGAVRLRRSR